MTERPVEDTGLNVDHGPWDAFNSVMDVLSDLIYRVRLPVHLYWLQLPAGDCRDTWAHDTRKLNEVRSDQTADRVLLQCWESIHHSCTITTSTQLLRILLHTL